MKKSNFFSDTTWITFSRVMAFTFKLLTDILIANKVGEKTYGQFSYYLLLILSLSSLLNFGIQVSNNYFVSSGKIDFSIVKNINKRFFVFISIFGMIIFLTFNLVINHRLTNFLNKNYIFLVIGGTSLVLLLLNNLVVSLFQSRKDIPLFSVTFPLNGIVLFFMVLLFLKLNFSTLPEIIVIYTTSLLITDVLGLLILNHKYTCRSERANIEQTKLFFSYGFKAYFSSVIIFLLPRIDMFLIAFFLPIEYVGFYAIALNISEKMLFLTISIATLLKPTLPPLNITESRSLIKRISRINLLITLVIACILFFGANYLTKIYAPEYKFAILPLKILAIAYIIFSMNTIIDEFFLGVEKPTSNLISYSIGLGFKLFTAYFFIKYLGIVGAAISTFITYLIIYLVKLIMLKNEIRFLDLILIKTEDIKYAVSKIKF